MSQEYTEQERAAIAKLFKDAKTVFETTIQTIDSIIDKTDTPNIGLMVLDLTMQYIQHQLAPEDAKILHETISKEGILIATIMTISGNRLTGASAIANQLSKMDPRDNTVRQTLLGVMLGRSQMVVLEGKESQAEKEGRPRKAEVAAGFENIQGILESIKRIGTE